MCRCSPHKMEGLEEEARTGGWVGRARTLQKYERMSQEVEKQRRRNGIYE